MVGTVLVMTQTALSSLSVSRFPAHEDLLQALGEALVLSDRLAVSAGADGEGALAWSCMEAWCEVVTVVMRTAVSVLPEGYAELL